MKSPYKIEIAPLAQRQLKKINQDARNLILKQIENLKNYPKPNGVKKLQGTDSLFRIRIKDYRIIYLIEDHRLTILVLKVGHRKEIYRNIPKADDF